MGNVVRGNSVQILSNFPAKSLSIYLDAFDNLMGIHLTNYRIYKENKDLYWWLFDLWENKDHNIAVFIQYIDE